MTRRRSIPCSSSTSTSLTHSSSPSSFPSSSLPISSSVQLLSRSYLPLPGIICCGGCIVSVSRPEHMCCILTPLWCPPLSSVPFPTFSFSLSIFPSHHGLLLCVPTVTPYNDLNYVAVPTAVNPGPPRPCMPPPPLRFCPPCPFPRLCSPSPSPGIQSLSSDPSWNPLFSCMHQQTLNDTRCIR